MPHVLTRRLMLAGGLASLATAGRAALRPYALIPERSRITFTFETGGTRQSGTVPVATADIAVDPTDLARSRAEVTADIRKVSTGMLFFTQAIKSPSLLDAENHPLVRFRSRAIRLGAQGRISEGAEIDGDLTLRGTTRPITLAAVLSRPAGSAPDDLTILFVQLTGRIDRQDYGASGYGGLAGNIVDLDIHAEIRARG